MATPGPRNPSIFGEPSIRRSLLWMMLAALAIRLIVAAFALPSILDPGIDHFPFGWEMGHVGRSIALGHGFGSPYQADTGPTAMLPPAYPYIVGAVFKLFGIFTKASAMVLLALQSLFSAVTCIPIRGIALWAFGPRAARVAGWLWTFFPYAIYLSAATIWSHTLSALLFALIAWLALRIAEGTGWRDWIWLGITAGVTGLTNPTILPVCAALVIWLWLRAPERRAEIMLCGATAALIGIACVAPWTIRNYEVFGHFVPLRSNFWAHVYGGNSLDTGKFWNDDHDPTVDPGELAEATRLGETAYMAEKKRQALEFISQHPRVYAYLVLKRVSYFWTGIFNLSPQFIRENPGETGDIPFCTALTVLALIGLVRLRRVDASRIWPFVICMGVYPVLYYFTTYEIAYHHPLDPVLIVLCGGALVRASLLRGSSRVGGFACDESR